jgi:hypothetical protein
MTSRTTPAPSRLAPPVVEEFRFVRGRAVLVDVEAGGTRATS